MAFIAIGAICDIHTGHILAYDNNPDNPEYALDIGFFDDFKKVNRFIKAELKNWQSADFNNHETANLQFRIDAVDCVDKKLERQLTQYIVTSKQHQPCLGDLNIEFCASAAIYRRRMADIAADTSLGFVYGKDYDEEIRAV